MRFVPVHGVQIAYDVLGTGKPVVMLHDFGQSSDFWLECGVATDCLAQGRQVVLIDLRGHGNSSSPADPNAYSAIECSQDVNAVLDHAGISRADFLGYGWGGRIALTLTAFAPDRVQALAVGGCHPFAERVQLSEVLADGPERRFSWPKARAERLDTGVTKSVIPIPTRAAVAAAPCDQPDVADALARSCVPLLLFLGREDPRCSLALTFAEQSRAKIIVVPDHDHESTAVAVGDAHLLSRIVQFLHAPHAGIDPDPLPPCLWSGAWA